jgi:Putative DNA-binding domain
MPPTPPGWAIRLTDVLGAPPTEVEEHHLQALVENGVREDADLDFKQARYGNGEQERRAFAGDIAAMANDRGGLIVIGIRDENDVAAEPTPVELVDGEEGRLRQTAAGNLAPYVPFEIRVVQTSEEQERGYYLLIVPPSSLRPHAVRQDRNLRYPRRDGTTTRWLSEAEVADMYRDRFRQATDQTERMTVVIEEGLRAMDTREDAFLAVGLVPTTSGSMRIDLARTRSLEQWVSDFGRPDWWRGFFHDRPVARVGARRVMVTTSLGGDRRPSWAYLELHTDGAGFAGLRLHDPRRNTDELGGTWVINQVVLLTLARCLRVLGRHARDNTGAWGDVLVEAQVVGTRMSLAYLHPQVVLFPERVEGGHTLDGPVTSRHTVTLDALVGRDQDLLATVRLVATDLFHAFGSPEVGHIAPDGTLRIRYFQGTHADHAQLRRLAEERGVEITEALLGD